MSALQSQIDDVVAQVRAETSVPGLSVCVEHVGTRYFSAAGLAQLSSDIPLTRAARFDLSCLMKFFLSVTALKLAAEGHIDLNCEISAQLPELGDSRGIRLIHLMSHTSGYHGVDITDMAVRWGSKWEGFAARFREASQLFRPGSTFNYEHSEHVILGEVLRRTFGQGPSALLHERLLAPTGVCLTAAAATEAGISAHAYSPRSGGYAPIKLPPFGPFWEASLPSMTITLDDVLTTAAAALGDKSIIERLCAPLIALPSMVASEPQAEKPPRHFSAACGLYDNGLVGHNGSMFGQTIGFRHDPRSGAVMVAGVNAYSVHARDMVLRRVLDLLAGDTSATSSMPSQALRWQREELMGDLTFEDVEGSYIGSYLGELTVVREGDGLAVIVGPENRQTRFEIATDDGGLIIRSRLPLSLRFQRGLKQPTLFLGVHAYQRQHLPHFHNGTVRVKPHLEEKI